MFLTKKFPYYTRIAYFYDVRSGIFFGIFNGFVIFFAPIIGLRMGATSLEVAVIMKGVYHENYRGKAMGYVRFFCNMSTMLASFAGGYLLDLGNGTFYRFIFPAGAAFGMTSSLLFRKIKIRRETKANALDRLSVIIKEFGKNNHLKYFTMSFFIVGTILYQRIGICLTLIISACVVMTGGVLMQFCRKKAYAAKIQVASMGVQAD